MTQNDNGAGPSPYYRETAVFSVLPKSVKRAKNPFFAIETTPKWLLAVNNSGKGYFFLLTKLPSHG